MKFFQLEFRISNGYGTKDISNEVCSSDDVLNAVNAAIDELGTDVEIVDIRTNFVCIAHHNNGGCDSIMEYVTILYR